MSRVRAARVMLIGIPAVALLSWAVGRDLVRGRGTAVSSIESALAAHATAASHDENIQRQLASLRSEVLLLRAAATAARVEVSSVAKGGDEPNSVPVPLGLPGKEMSASQSAALRAKRDLEQLERSGAASGSLTASALQVVEGWKHLPGVSSHGETGDFRCYRDGCSVTVTSPDLASADSVGSSVVREASFMTWPGRKFRSGAISLPSGQVQTVFILFRGKSENQP